MMSVNFPTEGLWKKSRQRLGKQLERLNLQSVGKEFEIYFTVKIQKNL